jgi:putative ABC transport system permease protein
LKPSLGRGDYAIQLPNAYLMRLALLFKLALRNLVRQRRRSALALAILAAGTMMVLLTRSWQTGMMDMIAREGAGTWVGGVQVMQDDARTSLHAFGLEPNVAVTDELVTRLRTTAHVSAITPRIRFLGKVFKGDEATPFVGMAMDFHQVPTVLPGLFNPDRIAQGRPPSAGDEVMLAESLAAILGVHPGDTLTLLARPVDGGLEGIDVKVAGVLSGAFEEELRRAIVIDLPLAQRMLRMTGHATEILLGVGPISETSSVAQALKANLKPAGLTALNYDEVKPRWKDARALWAMSLRIVFIIVLLVAILGLYTTVTLMVGERGREIGTLQALGIKRHWTVLILLVEAAILGAIGGLIGAAGALGIVAAVSKGVTFSIPGAGVYIIFPALTAGDLITAVVLAAIVIVLTTFRPALYIARRPPTVLLA